MSYQRFVFLAAMFSVLALLLAACTTTSDDDEVAEAADDTAAEVADDATDDEAAEEADDVVEEEADDAVVDEDDDDAAVEETDDATEDDEVDVETLDDVENEVPDEQLDAFLSELGFESLDEVAAPELNVETLEASTPGRTFQAEAYDNTYVGTVTENMYVAVSLDSPYADDAETLSVYVCDDELIGFYLTGELEDGQATIPLSEDAVIEFTVAENEVAGVITLGDQDHTFEATPATGDAGLYVVWDTVADEDFIARWIVLEDGSQRGRMCIDIWIFQICGNVCIGPCPEPPPPHVPTHPF